MITVNGKTYRLEKAVTLRAFLLANEYRLERIAVEKNGVIVARADYAKVLLEDGDKLEIVSFVGGG